MISGGKHLLQACSVPFLLIALVSFGVFIRLATLGSGVWRDEMWTLANIQTQSYEDMLKVMVPTDYNPPLYFLIMQRLSALFGYGEAALIAPSVVFGALQIPAVYFLAQTLQSRKTALLAAFFITISPEAIFYSNQVRNHSMNAFLLCIACGAFLMALRYAWHKEKEESPAEASRLYRRQSVYLAAVSTFLSLALYTSYMSTLLAIALALDTLLIRLRCKNFQMLPFVVALAVPCLLFLFWMPILWQQTQTGVPWQDKTPVIMWPLVFTSNLACIMPVPFPASFAVAGAFIATCLLWPLCLYLTGRRRARNETDQPAKDRAHPSSPSPHPRMIFALCVSVLVPCAALGYVTGFQTGYFRYMSNYTPAGCAMLAVACLYAFHKLDNAGRIVRIGARMTAASAIAVIFVACTMFAFTEGRSPKSGFREMARDVKAGMYDDSIFLIVPDAPGLTFKYYLEQFRADPSKYRLYGFVEPVPQPINCATYGPAWRDESSVPRTLELLRDEMKKSGFKQIVLALDSYQPDSRLIPGKQRIKQLYEALNAEYVTSGPKTTYFGMVETPTIFIFKERQR
jgi:hypothetical protein